MTHTHFLFAGEHSGDLHGAHLLHELKRLDPEARYMGVAGPRMREEGIEPFLPMEEFQVFGISNILMQLPRLIRQFYAVKKKILSLNPQTVTLIDYPGFNLRLAKALKKNGYRGKITQYNCPTVWAWGRGRIRTLVDYYDLLLTLFPFEPAIFKGMPLDVRFIGHPLPEKVDSYTLKPDFFRRFFLDPSDTIMAIFPGSRTGEVERHLPVQLEICKQMRSLGHNFKVAISAADAKREKQILEIAGRLGWKINHEFRLIPEAYTYDLMRSARTAIAKSGTVTLELALHNVPAIVIYLVSLPNYLIAMYVVRAVLKHYCMVNILCDRTVYPEFGGRKLDSSAALNALISLHVDGYERQACLDGLKETRLLLESAGGGVSQKAAQAILEPIQR